MTEEVVLTLSCKDRPGIVATVAGFLADRGYTIRDSQQFGDEDTGLFFMRVHAGSDDEVRLAELRSAFASVADDFEMEWNLHDTTAPHRLLVMVSKQGHCLNDLLFRMRTGSLRARIVAVVSNHSDLRDLVEWHGIPFHHVRVSAERKAKAEDELRRLVAVHQVDTVVLARYMQILSDGLCQDLQGRAINIHHSLLPSFKAHARTSRPMRGESRSSAPPPTT